MQINNKEILISTAVLSIDQVVKSVSVTTFENRENFILAKIEKYFL